MEILTHEFIDTFPKELEEGKIYVSIKYHSAAHRCCCGCGGKVITPISPKGWTLSFDGKTISLQPSIENVTFPCKSHYFITKNKVQWARNWLEGEHGTSENYSPEILVKPTAKPETKKRQGKKKNKDKGSFLKKLKNWVTPS